MKEKEFETWLRARRVRGRPLADKTIQNHIRRLRRVERSLKFMDYSTKDIDRVIERGGFPGLIVKLQGYLDLGSQGRDLVPLSLAPEAENPDNQLRNILSVVRLYEKFANGEDANDSEGLEDEEVEVGYVADDIREAALKHYILPARERGEMEVVIRAGELHELLGLEQAHPNVCQALGKKKFQQLAKVHPPVMEGAPNSTRTTFRFRLVEAGPSMPKRATTWIEKPTNVIFYGPPGTGKTYRTALEAVRLCDGDLPDGNRRAVMHRYRELERDGRIGFVTFHQSFSYEDFVEGLRPETTASETDGSPGFRLQPRKGIFCRMAALADQARLAASAPRTVSSLDLTGRRYWKMSLGAIGVEDHIYDEAIDGNYIVLGWGGSVDWSDPIYEDINAVRAKWAELQPIDSKPSNVSQLHSFRSEIKKGDIVIVPSGNSAFRAIAEVTGDYVYVQTADGEYNHRRQVNWLLKLERPLPIESIIEGSFTMRTLYPINARRIRLDVLSRMVGAESEALSVGADEPDAFVLIIDEINRANISKVFGELITLLEPDKRLGMDNEIRVTLPYSGETFGVPFNLHLIGTMNTADRSIALLDTALRRRFTFEEIMPEPARLKEAAERTGIDLVAVLKTMNERIEYLFDRDHQIGHAFFMDCDNRYDVDAAMRNRVIPLLQEYFFEDWSRVAMVLGEREGVRNGAFLHCHRIAPPPGHDGEDRWRWSVRPEFASDAYQRLVGLAAVPEAYQEAIYRDDARLEEGSDDE